MNALSSTITLFFAVSMLFVSNLNAKELKQKTKPGDITKAFFLDCQKKSIADPYSDMRTEEHPI